MSRFILPFLYTVKQYKSIKFSICRRFLFNFLIFWTKLFTIFELEITHSFIWTLIKVWIRNSRDEKIEKSHVHLVSHYFQLMSLLCNESISWVILIFLGIYFISEISKVQREIFPRFIFVLFRYRFLFSSSLNPSNLYLPFYPSNDTKNSLSNICKFKTFQNHWTYAKKRLSDCFAMVQQEA